MNQKLRQILDAIEQPGQLDEATRHELFDKVNEVQQELDIELALEKVRARAMAMHNSQDLADTIGVFYNELQSFNLTPRRCGVGLLDRESRVGDLFTWNTTAEGESLELFGRLKMEGHPVLDNLYEGWLSQTEYRPVLRGNEIKEYYEIIRPQIAFPDYKDDDVQYGYFFFFSEGWVYAWTEKEMHEDEVQIYRRFTSVLSLTYKRYKDLQKSEAQAREAQIEASLEKVRAVAMSMMKSEEFPAVCESIYKQLVQLGFEEIRSVQIYVLDDGAGRLLNYEYSDALLGKIYKIKYGGHALIDTFINDVRDGKEDLITRTITGTAIDNWRNHLYNTLGQEHEPLLDKADSLNYYHYSIGEGTLCITAYKHLKDEQLLIVQRLSNVFGLSYKRYKDISLAEAQAREAHIEAALERVRSRSLAMHDSNELKDVVAVLFQQLKILGVGFDGGAAIHLFSEDSKDAIILVASPDLTSPIQVNLPYDQDAFVNNPIIADVWNAKETGNNIFNRVYSFEEKNKYFDYVFKHNGFEIIPQLSRDSIRKADSYTASFIAEKNSLLGANSWSRQLFSENDFDVLKRIAKVFEQAYVRFLDLQKAEEQAREAQIEVALERVRAKTMAMHKSEQLAETAKVFFQQFYMLGEIPDRMSIGIFNEESNKVELWVTDQSGNQVNNLYFFAIDEPTSIAKIYDAWKDKKDTEVVDLTGDKLQQWLHFVKEVARLPIDETKIKGRRVQQAVFFSKGFLLFTTHEPVSKKVMALLLRFARVFDLTYTRFLDLQKAEAQAREAKIEAALERVRSKVQAMRFSGDLLEVANVLREQMGQMGQPELESCIVHLYSDKSETYEVWYAFRPPGDTSGKIVTGTAINFINSSEWTREVIEKYRSPESEYTIESSGEKLKEWYRVLEKFAPETVEYDINGDLLVP